jgi:hypothetical protein
MAGALEPHMPEPPKTNEKAELITWAVVVGLVVAFFVAIPVALGLAVWYPLRNRIHRGEAAIFLATGLLGTVIAWRSVGGPYVGWLFTLVTGNGNRLDLPWVSLLLWTLVTVGALALLHRSPIAMRVEAKVLRRSGEESVMPSEEERKRAKVTAPPQMTVSADSHSIRNPSKFGTRAIPIGTEISGKPYELHEEEFKTHGVVLGSTGAGKTETIKTLIGGLADIGYAVIMVDLKEDTAEGGLREFCDHYAAAHAQPYQQIALSDPNPTYWFNPLYKMSTDEAINTIVSLQEFDDGFWQAINRTMIGQICTLVSDAHQVDPTRFPPPDMLTIGRIFRSSSLASATKEMRAAVLASMPARTKDDFMALSSPSPDEAKSASGLGARIVNTYESEAGRSVLRSGGDREVLDVTRPGITYIGLNTLGLSELARVVSTSVLMRVATYAGARTTGAVKGAGESRIAVVIDEANFIDRIQIQNLLSRCRSAGISVWLCTQSPLDWEEDWPKITSNVNVGIIMLQGNEESAELCADFIGKRKMSTLLSQVRDGQVTESGTMRESVEHFVSAQELRNLRVGESVVTVTRPEPRRTFVRIFRRPASAQAGR